MVQDGWQVTSGANDPATVDRLLRSLPEWFGIESSIVEYVESAHRLPTYLARPAGGGDPVGVLLATRHFPESAEIHLMAVDRAWHRHGAGRALVGALEVDLVADGVSLLQVKTLGPARPNASYDLTRQFYRSLGFLPLEEIHELWPGNPCLVMVKPLSDPRAL